MSGDRRTVTSWRTEHRCVNCGSILSLEQKMGSIGCCPKCGFKAKDAVTIVSTRVRAYRFVRDGAWWAFWKPWRKEYRGPAKPLRGYMGDSSNSPLGPHDA